MLFEKKVLDIYRGTMYARCDDKGIAYYFSAADFEGLRQEPFAFPASAGHMLQGYFYSYEDPLCEGLVVFDHGFGGGHRSYMKEIEQLCRHGYTVFAYDHTGCWESGGDGPNGMSQSLCDLNDCIRALRQDQRYADADISVIGHSWGGFSTLNISALHPTLKHIVVLSGFVSVQSLVDSFFSGLLRGYRKSVMALERASNPTFVTYDAVQTLRAAQMPVLLIYSDNDTVCRRWHYDTLKAGLSDKANIRFWSESGKGHNPNYTKDAVKYLGKYEREKGRRMKKGLLKTAQQKAAFRAELDWNRMTAQDETVWQVIFDCLDS
jgi:pimeloyl-ACP methyl ester carboxylesterase